MEIQKVGSERGARYAWQAVAAFLLQIGVFSALLSLPGLYPEISGVSRIQDKDITPFIQCLLVSLYVVPPIAIFLALRALRYTKINPSVGGAIFARLAIWFAVIFYLFVGVVGYLSFSRGLSG